MIHLRRFIGGLFAAILLAPVAIIVIALILLAIVLAPIAAILLAIFSGIYSLGESFTG